MKKNQIDIITLGCSKNLVDSELLMKQFEANGYHCVHDSKRPQGEIAVINTCVAAVQIAEFLFHENAPFYFLPGTVGIMLRPCNFIVLYSFRNYNAFFWPDGQFGNIPVGIALWGHPVDFRIIPRQKRNHNI